MLRTVALVAGLALGAEQPRRLSATTAARLAPLVARLALVAQQSRRHVRARRRRPARRAVDVSRRGNRPQGGAPVLGGAAAGRSLDPPEQFGLDGYADCLAGFLAELGLDAAHVAGLSFGGIVALALQRRHSAVSSSLILASAYAGWAGSLPADVAQQRLRQALASADGAPEAFVDALLPTMFSKTTPRETVDDFRATMQAFHPRGFRAMAGASAEDVRDVLPRVDVPTLLLYGDRDVRAPLTVAEALQAAISRSNLVLLPDAGHLCNIEAPDEFNAVVRDFLYDSRR
jgi:pimeloyl-ACP methyl ester carboxylesterase